MAYTEAPAGSWGAYAKPAGDQVPDGLYTAQILEEILVVDQTGKPKLSEDGKFKAKITLRLRQPDQSIATLSTTMSVSFGMNRQTRSYSRFASYIEALHGVPCGDPAQQVIAPGAGAKKLCRVIVKNANGYSNIDSFMSAQGTPVPQPSAVPPAAYAQTASTYSPKQESESFPSANASGWDASQPDEIPF